MTKPKSDPRSCWWLLKRPFLTPFAVKFVGDGLTRREVLELRPEAMDAEPLGYFDPRCRRTLPKSDDDV